MRITKISPCRTDKSRVMVYFEDRSFCKVDMLLARQLGLKPGDTVDGEILPALNEDTRRAKARETAARVLGKRNMSRAELNRKLGEKGISPEDAEYACRWAIEVGVIDDEAYAQMLMRHYRSKGFGNVRIRSELSRRGIDAGMISILLEEEVDMSAEIRDFIQKKLKGNRADPDTVRKVTAALMRRGHSYSQIRATFKSFEIDMEDND